MENTQYVCGFAFNPSRSRVVLITKNRPKFLAGKMNGIGGKVEDGETHCDAMVREFQEETGVETTILDWQIIGKMKFALGAVVFYGAILTDEQIDSAITTTDEIISVVSVVEILEGNYYKMDVDGYLYFIGYLTRGDDLKTIYVEYN